MLINGCWTASIEKRNTQLLSQHTADRNKTHAIKCVQWLPIEPQKNAYTYTWSEGKKTRIYLAKTLAGRFQFNVMRQYQATLAVVSLDGFVLNVAMCECMSKIPARKKHNMVQRVIEKRYKKPIDCLSIYTKRMSMEFVRYISISVRDSKANSYSHSSHHHHMALYSIGAHFFSLLTFSLYGYFFFVRSFILSCYLRVYRFNNNEKKNCISFNAIVFLIIISRNLAHDSFHTTRTFGLVFFVILNALLWLCTGRRFFPFNVLYSKLEVRACYTPCC